MKFKTLRPLLFVFLGPLSSCPAQRTLDFFVQQAFANDPAIRDFDNRQRSLELDRQMVIAQNRKPEVTASSDLVLAPFFSAKGVEITPNPSDKAFGFDPAISNGATYSALVNATLPIFNDRTVQPQVEQWNIQTLVLANQIALQKRDLRKAVADQYVNTLAIQEQFALSDTLLSLLDTEIGILEKLNAAGLATAVDIENLRLERDNERVARLKIEIDFARNLAQLYLLAGLTDTARVLLSAEGFELVPAAGRVAMHEKFRLDSLLAQNQQTVFETRYRPTLNLAASAGLNAVEWNGIYRRVGVQGGVSFQQPLYDGHQRRLTRSQTRISLETLATYRAAFDRQRQISLAADAAQLRALDELLRAYEGQTAAYHRLFDATRRLTGKGLSYSSIDVLNAVLQSKRVELDRIAARASQRLLINDIYFWNE